MTQFLDLQWSNDPAQATHVLFAASDDPVLPTPAQDPPPVALSMAWIEACVAQNEVLDVDAYILPPRSNKRPVSDEHASSPSDKRPRQEVPETPLSAEEAFEILEETVAQSEPEGGWKLPPSASWFSLDSVHQIEREALPEFFSGTNRSKTPELYCKYRRFLVLTYRLNPEEYLTLTACRRVLAGDVWGLMRIHKFLDLRGVINTLVPPSRRPQKLQPAFTGHFRLLLDTPYGLRPIEPPAGREEKEALPIRTGIYQTRTSSVTPWSESDAQSVLVPRSRALPRPSCDTCGELCVERYVLIAPGSGPTLCAKCYSAARFPAPLRASDFVRLPEASGDAKWSQAETLRLLNALQQYGTAWPRVAQAVATRSPQECAERFLQLPIEDPYLPQRSELETVQEDWAALRELARWARPGLARRAARNAVAALERAVGSSSTTGVNGSVNKSLSGVELSSDATLTQAPNGTTNGASQSTEDSTGPPSRLHIRPTKDERASQSEFVGLVQAQMERYEAKMQHILALDARLARERHDLAKEERQIYSQRLLVRKHLKQTSFLLDQHRRAQLESTRAHAQAHPQAQAATLPSIPPDQTQRLPLPR